MTKKKQKKTYRMETAKVADMRLANSRPVPVVRVGATVEEAREIILRLIEAIKRL